MSDDELIDGIYKDVMTISKGGSSQVLECAEQATGRHVAMKLLNDESPDFKDNKKVMRHEAEVMKTLDHPLIIKFERFSTNRDYTYIVMEHFRASNVKLQLKADMRSVHVRARKLLESVCAALSHVHSKGWIHRDIKPDNVLMNKVGEIRLVDFSLATKEVKGFSKMIGGGKQKVIQGTRTYIAPETIRKQTPTFKTDIYSLGVLFFEVLTGRTPFQAPTPEELLKKHLHEEAPYPSSYNENVTPEMDRLVFRMLKKKPADRPESVDEVLGELRRIKIFKEDVVEYNAAEDEEKSKSMDVLTEIRLDSRADAKLQVMLQANPELARQFAEEKQTKSDKKQREAARVKERAKTMKETQKGKKAQAEPPPQVQQPMMPMMPMPGYMPQPQFAPYPPQQPFGMPPGMGMPPGAGMMPGMPPGMAPPGMMVPGAVSPPGYPPTGFPPQGPMSPPMTAPPQFGAPAMPPAGFPPQMQPAPAAPAAAPVPAAVSRPAAPPAAAPTVAAQRPAAPQPAAPKPAAPKAATASPAVAKQPATSSRPSAPAQPAPPAKEPINPDELEFMTELPDIL